MVCSTEMAEARIDMPVKPADAASGASAPIGIAAMSFRVDDSAIRQERESCNDLAVERYVDVAECAEICDHLVSGLDIKRFGTSAGRDDLPGFNGEAKSGYFLDQPKQGAAARDASAASVGGARTSPRLFVPESASPFVKK